MTECVRPTFQSQPCGVRSVAYQIGRGAISNPTPRTKTGTKWQATTPSPGFSGLHLSPGRREAHPLSSTRPPEQTLRDPPQEGRSCPLPFPGTPATPDSVPVPDLTGIPDQWPPSRNEGVASGARHSGRAGPAPVDGCQNCGRKASAMRGVANVRQLRGEGKGSRIRETGSAQGRGMAGSEFRDVLLSCSCRRLDPPPPRLPFEFTMPLVSCATEMPSGRRPSRILTTCLAGREGATAPVRLPSPMDPVHAPTAPSSAITLHEILGPGSVGEGRSCEGAGMPS